MKLIKNLRQFSRRLAAFLFLALAGLGFVNRLYAAPPAVTSFIAEQDDQILLSWAVPVGTESATSFVIRYSTTGPIITETDYTTATLLYIQPAALTPGTTQTQLVTSLTQLVTYYWVIKSSDINGPSGVDTAVPEPFMWVSSTPNILTASFTVLPSDVHNPFPGFQALYYSDDQFVTFASSRVDQNVAFDWCSDPLPPNTQNNLFSASWQSYVWLERTTYTFSLSNIQQSGKIYLNGAIIADTDVNLASTTLDTGRKVNLRVAYSKSGALCPKITMTNTPGVKGPDEWIYQAGIGAFAKLKLSVDQGAARISKIKIQRTGSSSDLDADLTGGVIIYRDTNNSGFLEPNVDQAIGTGTFVAGYSDVTIQLTTVAVSKPVTLLLAYKISVNGTDGATIGMSIPNSTYITLANPAKTNISAAGFPFTSSTFAIHQTIDLLLQQATDISPSTRTIIQGDANYPFIKLPLWADNNGFTLTGINVKRLGTSSDADFTAVKVYKDSNGNGIYDGGDSLISSGLNTFSNSVASITLVTPQIISVATQTYFIVGDFGAFATVGKTAGMQLTSTQAFVVASPDSVANNGYPFSTVLTNINEYPDVVQISSFASIAPSGVNQAQTDVPMARIVMRTGLSTAGWTKLRVDKLGNIEEGYITAVKIYKDINSNGMLDSTVDTLVSTGTNLIAGGVSQIQISTQTLGPADATYFIAVDISSNAIPFRTFGLNIANTAYFTILAPNSMGANLIPSSTTLSTVQEPPTTLTVTGSNLASVNASQADTNVGMLRLQLKMDKYTAQWTALKVILTGTGSDSDVSAVKLYYDLNHSSAFEPLSDQLIATGTFSQGRVTLSFLTPQSLGDSTSNYFLTYDIASNATAGASIGARITNNNFFTLTAPDLVATTNFPIDSSSMTLVATQDGLLVVGADHGLATVAQGSTTSVFVDLTLSATAHTVTWTGVTIDKTGTIADSDVKAVHVFQDVNGDGELQSSDIEITSGLNIFSSGRSNIVFPNTVNISTNPVKYLVTLETISTAKIGGTLGLTISTAGSLSVLPPDFVVVSGFPVSSSLATITDRPDSIVLTTSSLAASSIYQGAKNEPILKMNVSVNDDQALWTALRLDRTGTLSDSAVTAVKLYKDANGNGVLDSSTDTLVATTFFTGGVASLGFTAQSISTSPVSYFIAMDLADDSPVDATIGVRITNSSYLTVATPDNVASFSSFGSVAGKIIDKRTPTTPVVTDDGQYTGKFDTLSFSWLSTVPSGTLSEARYAIGTSTSDKSIRDWTSIDASQTNVTVTGLTLLDGKTYFFLVQSKSSFNVWSSTGYSDGITLDLAKPKVTSEPSATIKGDIFVLTWALSSSPNSGTAGYIIEEKPGDKPNFRTFDPGTQPSAVKIFATPFAGQMAPTVTSNAVVISGKNPGTYSYRVRPVSGAGVIGDPSPPVRVDFALASLPSVSSISNFPNPFDSRKQKTTIAYTLRDDAGVNLRIYDAFGGRVRELRYDAGTDGGKSGANQVVWDGTDDGGAKVSQGVYYLIVDVAGDTSTSSKKPLIVGVIH